MNLKFCEFRVLILEIEGQQKLRHILILRVKDSVTDGFTDSHFQKSMNSRSGTTKIYKTIEKWKLKFFTNPIFLSRKDFYLYETKVKIITRDTKKKEEKQKQKTKKRDQK